MGSVMKYAMNNVVGGAKNSKLKGIGAMGIAGGIIDGGLTYSMNRKEDPDGSKLVDGMQAVGTAAAWMFAEPLMWGITAGQAGVGLLKMAHEEDTQNENIVRQHAMNNKSMDLTTGKTIKRDKDAPIRPHKSGANSLYQATLGGNFEDSEQAATLRQKQIQSMRQTRIQTENILGSEARQLHR